MPGPSRSSGTSCRRLVVPARSPGLGPLDAVPAEGPLVQVAAGGVPDDDALGVHEARRRDGAALEQEVDGILDRVEPLLWFQGSLADNWNDMDVRRKPAVTQLVLRPTRVEQGPSALADVVAPGDADA